MRDKFRNQLTELGVMFKDRADGIVWKIGQETTCMAKRAENERKYKNWDELPDGGRRYWYDSPGRHIKGFARYIKIVDANEVTLSFVQEIYDEHGKLISIHPKYPADTGHQPIEQDEDDQE